MWTDFPLVLESPAVVASNRAAVPYPQRCCVQVIVAANL